MYIGAQVRAPSLERQEQPRVTALELQDLLVFVFLEGHFAGPQASADSRAKRLETAACLAVGLPAYGPAGAWRNQCVHDRASCCTDNHCPRTGRAPRCASPPALLVRQEKKKKTNLRPDMEELSCICRRRQAPTHPIQTRGPSSIAFEHTRLLS